MKERYITKLLTFSDENLMRNIETISLSRKNVKELLKEIHTDYIPIFNIQNKIKILENLQNEFKDNEEIRIKIIAYKELLDERSNTDER